MAKPKDLLFHFIHYPPHFVHRTRLYIGIQEQMHYLCNVN